MEIYGRKCANNSDILNTSLKNRVSGYKLILAFVPD
jgi:hypothetical protein